MSLKTSDIERRNIKVSKLSGRLAPNSPRKMVDVDLTSVKIEGRSNVASDANLKQKKAEESKENEQLQTDEAVDLSDWAGTMQDAATP